VRHYTREAGVRQTGAAHQHRLPQAARRIAEGKTGTLVVDRAVIQEFLGGIKVRVDTELAGAHSACRGRGWAWPGRRRAAMCSSSKPTGMKGKGGFKMTGQIGEVMQESMQAALTWVRSNAASLGLEEDFTKDLDLHIHVPAGAIPKDGPSAGVTMATTLVSLMTRYAGSSAHGDDGEITLSGNVLR